MELHDVVSALKLLASDLGKTPTLREFVAIAKISRRQISKHGYVNLCKMAGLEPNLSSQQKPQHTIESSPPKILILDIETAPLLVRCYDLWNQNISTGFIVKDWYIISFAAKWAGEKKVYYWDTKDSHEDDREVCQNA